MGEPRELTLHGLRRALMAGETTSVAATRSCLQRAAETAHLGAFLHLDEQNALRQAAAADDRRQQGAGRGPLDGVPVAVKDNLAVVDLPLTCGSRLLENFVAPYDATVVSALRQAGAVLLGKASLDEFAMGSSTEHCAYGPARNPWDPTRVPGGSSGGAAVAVASEAAMAALGSDTGGSIRQPAAFCGLVGVKPTYGRVSRYGLVAFASSLDQIGPLTRDVTDAALVLQAIAGPDGRDSTSADVTVPDYRAELNQGVVGLRLGVPREYQGEGVAPAVRAAVDEAVATFERLGAKITEVSLPHTDYAVACYYLLCTAEASSNLARFDGVRYGVRHDPGTLAEMYRQSRSQGFGTEVKRRILLGTFALSTGYYEAYYRRAQKVRSLICNDFTAALAEVDLLVTPTTPTTAFRLGEKITDPLAMYLGDVFTVGASLAGLPALSLPCGRDEAGLPIGLQLIAGPWQEPLLLRAGRAFERDQAQPRRPTP